MTLFLINLHWIRAALNFILCITTKINIFYFNLYRLIPKFAHLFHDVKQIFTKSVMKIHLAVFELWKIARPVSKHRGVCQERAHCGLELKQMLVTLRDALCKLWINKYWPRSCQGLEHRDQNDDFKHVINEINTIILMKYKQMMETVLFVYKYIIMRYKEFRCFHLCKPITPQGLEIQCSIREDSAYKCKS